MGCRAVSTPFTSIPVPFLSNGGEEGEGARMPWAKIHPFPLIPGRLCG